MQKTALKILFLAEVMNFEKIIQARGLKLGSYVPFMSFYKLISGIFEKHFFRFLWPKSFFCRYLKKLRSWSLMLYSVLI